MTGRTGSCWELSDFLDNQCQVERIGLRADRQMFLLSLPLWGQFIQILVAYEMEIWDMRTLKTIHSHLVPALTDLSHTLAGAALSILTTHNKTIVLELSSSSDETCIHRSESLISWQ